MILSFIVPENISKQYIDKRIGIALQGAQKEIDEMQEIQTVQEVLCFH